MTLGNTAQSTPYGLAAHLLAVPDMQLEDPDAADYSEDGILDVFDLCMMKQA